MTAGCDPTGEDLVRGASVGATTGYDPTGAGLAKGASAGATTGCDPTGEGKLKLVMLGSKPLAVQRFPALTSRESVRPG